MAFLRGFGSYLPERRMSNEEVAALVGCEAAWILGASGIEERRIAASGETVVSMAVQAARDCLARCAVPTSEIGLVIVAGGSADRRFPGPAAEVVQQLGLPGVPAIDLPMASAGSLFGLVLASRLADAYGEVLVVAAEKMSSVVFREPLNRNVAILFGDGAGAALVSARAGLARVLDSCIHSDGAFAADLRLDLDGPLEMNGQVVILQSSRKIPAAIQEVLERSGRAATDVDTFVMHQANRNLIVRVARALNVPEQSFYTNIERYGNTSSASMFIAAAECAQNGNLFRHEHSAVVFAGFGAGFHWGALIAAAA